MIELLIPYNRGGKVIPAGTEIHLPADEENRLIAAENAKQISAKEAPVEEEEKPKVKAGKNRGE